MIVTVMPQLVVLGDRGTAACTNLCELQQESIVDDIQVGDLQDTCMLHTDGETRWCRIYYPTASRAVQGSSAVHSLPSWR